MIHRLVRWEGTRLGRPSQLLLGRLGTGGASSGVTVEPAREIGAGRLRGGRTRFGRARTILDYITKAGHPSPDPTVEAVAVAGPSLQSCT